jgi:mRNA interferase MazF
VVVSPDELNHHISIVIVVPLTTTPRGYPSRIHVRFQGKAGEAALDQIRTIDKTRMVKRLGRLNEATADEIARTLVEMFTRS